MATDVTLVYEGPQQRLVELDRDVFGGDEIEVPRELADRLICAHGFREKGKRPDAAPKLATRKTLEARAADMGLAVYEGEEDERLANRIREHGGDPTSGPTKAAKGAGAGEKALTPKQQAVAEAEELGLSTAGTEVEIRDRIAEHLAGGQGGSDGTGGGS